LRGGEERFRACAAFLPAARGTRRELARPEGRRLPAAFFFAGLCAAATFLPDLRLAAVFFRGGRRAAFFFAAGFRLAAVLLRRAVVFLLLRFFLTMVGLYIRSASDCVAAGRHEVL
jgi:hypothetical protein